jgi:hypothetical protein
MNQAMFADNHGKPMVPNTLAVYRNLRIGMGVTAVMLAASITIQSTYVTLHGDNHEICWQEVLSAYFYTSAHSIFVAALLGLATLFFVYRGTCDTENALLQLAGVAAVTAALVPMGEGYVHLCQPPPLTIPDDDAVKAAIRSNLWAVVAALAVAWVITWFQRHYDRKDRTGKKIRQQKSPGGNLVRCFLRMVLVVGLIALCAYKVDSRNVAHAAAGLLLLSSFIATVFVTAFVASREERKPRGHTAHCFFKWFYWVWAVGMLLTLLGIVAAIFLWPKLFGQHGGTILEAAVLVEFGAYWVVQTFDLWDDPDRRYRLSTADRDRIAQTYGDAGDTRQSPADKIMAFL